MSKKIYLWGYLHEISHLLEMSENLFQDPRRKKIQSKSYLNIPLIKRENYGTLTRDPNNLVKGKICPSKLLSEEFRFSHVLAFAVT